MFGIARKLLVTLGLAGALLLSTATMGHASPTVRDAPTAAAEDVGVLGGCEVLIGCGTVVNATNRGFYVTLLWGGPWNDTNVKWVSAWSSLGGNGVDVDGILVAEGCVMSGVINGRVPGYNYPFVWTSGWHKIWTNETALVSSYIC